MEKMKWRWFTIVVVTFLGILWILPNLTDVKPDSILPKQKLVMGLDIQGGLHIVMGVDADTVIKEKITRMISNLENDLKDKQIPYNSIKVSGENFDKIEISYIATGSQQKLEKYFNDNYGTVLQVLSTTADKMELKYYEAFVLEMRKQIVEQAIEVIRNRIDEFGVAEPSITAQGDNRILVQLPGIKDAQRAKDLINRTARLTFKIVSTEMGPDKLSELISEVEKQGGYTLGGEKGLKYQDYIKRLNSDLSTKLPKNTYVAFEKLENAVSLEAGRRPFLLDAANLVTGEHLEDAFVSRDQYGKPIVSFRMNVEGRKLFADLTEKAAGGFLAIVLDDVVKSAPTVRQKIDSESAQIELGAMNQQEALAEAQFISTALRAGALPAALEQLEERTVGPSLGQDSLKKANAGALVGAASVILFMIAYYGVLGLVAAIAIALNLLLVFSALTSLGATLTLPGIAGMALTVGMAVDANIIIYERIREELARGASQLAAMRDGFANAFSAIFDSNITTILTCFVLMYYGTGPVRGFAVSLAIGIIASMFTSLFVARTIAETLVLKFQINLMKPKARLA